MRKGYLKVNRLQQNLAYAFDPCAKRDSLKLVSLRIHRTVALMAT